jgi:hypothetical protein
MMGVHGNGLTSLLWMNPNPRSTVIEFFYPQGFAHDYEYTTRALGMTHYGFWNNEWVAILFKEPLDLTLFLNKVFYKSRSTSTEIR